MRSGRISRVALAAAIVQISTQRHREHREHRDPFFLRKEALRALCALCVSVLIILGGYVAAAAQFRGYRAYREPSLKYDDKWTFTRIRYGPNSSWNHDYPRADRHLAYIVSDLSMARSPTD